MHVQTLTSFSGVKTMSSGGKASNEKGPSSVSKSCVPIATNVRFLRKTHHAKHDKDKQKKNNLLRNRHRSTLSHQNTLRLSAHFISNT